MIRFQLPPPRHARTTVLTPGRWLLPTSAMTSVALVPLVIWFAVTGAPTARHRLPPAGPAPLAAAALAGRAPGEARTGALAGKPAILHGRARPAKRSAPPLSASRSSDAAEASALAASGIPVTALQAYRRAAAREHALRPSCGLTWPLLAGIGRVESDHGRFAGAVLHADGRSTPPIIGIPLNGHGTALIRDTDHGRLDGDTVYDRAVGPMQFIPSTWASWKVDANHDGVADPFNIFDAAAAAADYLCAAGGNLRTYAGQVRAVRSYNDSTAYVALVLAMERSYASGAGVVVPVVPGSGAAGPQSKPTLPPVNPARPPGLPKRRSHRQHGPSRSPSASPTARPRPPRKPSPTLTPPAAPSTPPPSSSSRSPSLSPSPSGCPTPTASSTSSPTPTPTPTSVPDSAPRSSSPAPSSCPTTSAASSSASSTASSTAPPSLATSPRRARVH